MGCPKYLNFNWKIHSDVFFDSILVWFNIEQIKIDQIWYNFPKHCIRNEALILFINLKILMMYANKLWPFKLCPIFSLLWFIKSLILNLGNWKMKIDASEKFKLVLFALKNKSHLICFFMEDTNSNIMSSKCVSRKENA